MLNSHHVRTGETLTVDERSFTKLTSLEGVRNLVLIPSTRTVHPRLPPTVTSAEIPREKWGMVSELKSISLTVSRLKDLQGNIRLKKMEVVSVDGSCGFTHLDLRLVEKVFPRVKHLTVKNVYLNPLTKDVSLPALETLTVDGDPLVADSIRFSSSLYVFEFFSEHFLEKRPEFIFRWKRGNVSYGLDEIEKILEALSQGTGFECLDISSKQIRALDGKTFPGLTDEVCVISPDGDAKDALLDAASKIFGVDNVYNETEEERIMHSHF